MNKPKTAVAGTYGPPKGTLAKPAAAVADKPKPNSYLERAVMTAGKEQLLMMLLDGAIRFTDRGREAIVAQDATEAHTNLVRAQEIVTELMASLKADIGSEIYRNLVGLYHFVYERLVRANVEKSTQMADEARQTLKGVREMWAAAIDRMNEEGRPEELNPSQIRTHRMDAEG
ncbi:MAG: flagellar export chaperone FliS [Planctomycetes bacterium]|nr:flagellar export chaperone FliS [Planctomycetota bacterium]